MLQGLNEPPGAAQADVPGLQLALAVIVSLYVLRDKKRLDLGKHLLFTTLGLISVCQASMIPLNTSIYAVRAGGITAAGLIAGAVIGSALQSWLRVDIVPIGVSTCSFVHSMEHTEAIIVMKAVPDKFAHIVSAVLMVHTCVHCECCSGTVMCRPHMY